MSNAYYNDRNSPDSASIEKKDDARLEDGIMIAPVLTAGTTNADAVASTIEDPRETARILRKLDWHVIPICAVLYLFVSTLGFSSAYHMVVAPLTGLGLLIRFR